MRTWWIAVAALVAAGSAAAQEPGSARSVPQSPRTSAVEIKFGSIKPMLNREAALTSNPYDDTFGPDPMLLGELELDYYLYQGIGAAGVGLSVGYAEKYGRAEVVDDAGNVTGPAAESTGLFLLPIRLQAVYRFDWAVKQYRIPLVPFAKAGVIYTPWWVTKGREIEVVDGERAAGGKWGYGGSVGLALLLDFFDPRLARDFDNSIGVNHSYVFAEFTYADVNNFGAGGLDLSTRHFMFGLTLEL